MRSKMVARGNHPTTMVDSVLAVDRQCEASKTKEPPSELFVGNVHDSTPLPEGCEGPVEKGHLVFDACFEEGPV